MIRTVADLDSLDDGKLVTVTHFDELGRPEQTRSTDCPPTGPCEVPALNPSDTDGVKVETRYRIDDVNKVTYQLVSNPYRSTGDDTMGWTLTKLDQLGRVVEVETFDGADPPDPWGSNNSSTGVVTTNNSSDETTVTDQAGKVRRSTVDGLGRLVKVEEDPGTSNLNYVTTYAYDFLDNLETVCQNDNGSSCGQTRTFVYNSLSRLTSATNPESGTIDYTYDANGNLDRRTDGRNTEIDNDYDELNRLTTTSYTLGTDTAATPTTRYCYDGLTWDTSSCTGNRTAPNIGQLTHVYRALSDTKFTYDDLGRVITSEQNTDAPDGSGRKSYSFSYEYNQADGLTKQTNPSGRELTYGYDDAGRIDDADGTYQTIPTGYADGFTYTPHGAISQMTLGNGLVESTQFNRRLQPTDLRLGTSAGAFNLWRAQFGYDDPVSGGNDGNVYSQILDAPGLPATLTQAYTYDGANRLEGVNETGGTTNWSRAYYYDPFGNRAVQGDGLGMGSPDCANATDPGCNAGSVDFGATTNRLLTLFADYDDAGNQTEVRMPGNACMDRFLVYDAENREASFTELLDMDEDCDPPNEPTRTTTYHYDGNGNRVKKVFDANSAQPSVTLFVYDAFGNLAAEYAGEAPSGPTGTQYRTTDHLGSTRVVTDASPTPKVVSRRDFFPFGEEIMASDTFGNRDDVTGYNAPSGYRQQFTEKERDDESKFDYFLARYYTGSLGRFTSVDPIDIMEQKVVDPQKWPSYAYGRNNPLRFVDPTGEYNTDCKSKDISECSAEIQTFEQVRQQNLNSNDKRVRDAAAAYGSFNDGNNVTVKIDPSAARGSSAQDRDAAGNLLNSFTVTFPTIDRPLVAHEGSHLADQLAASQGATPLNQFDSEVKAFATGAATLLDHPSLNLYAVQPSQIISDGGASMTLYAPISGLVEAANRSSIITFLGASTTYSLTPTKPGLPIYAKPKRTK